MSGDRCDQPALFELGAGERGSGFAEHAEGEPRDVVGAIELRAQRIAIGVELVRRRIEVERFSDTVELPAGKRVAVGQWKAGAVPESREGTLDFADVTLGSETIVAASAYAVWETPSDKGSLINVAASAHRLVSVFQLPLPAGFLRPLAPPC